MTDVSINPVALKASIESIRGIANALSAQCDALLVGLDEVIAANNAAEYTGPSLGRSLIETMGQPEDPDDEVGCYGS